MHNFIRPNDFCLYTFGFSLLLMFSPGSPTSSSSVKNVHIRRSGNSKLFNVVSASVADVCLSVWSCDDLATRVCPCLHLKTAGMESRAAATLSAGEAMMDG